MSDPLDDDIPWADPAIRTDYEAALGRFILAYNEVDYRVSQVIRSELTRRGRPDLAETASKGQFAQRLETLAILGTSKDGHLAALPLVAFPIAPRQPAGSAVHICGRPCGRHSCRY
jgi:hypothetical protein